MTLYRKRPSTTTPGISLNSVVEHHMEFRFYDRDVVPVARLNTSFRIYRALGVGRAPEDFRR